MFFTDVAYAMGSTGGGAEAGSSPLSMNILLMVVIFAIFYFLIIRPQSKEARRIKDMLAALKRGDRVITVGGIYGEVVEIKGDVVLLDLGDSTVEVGLKYIANLAEGRSLAASSGKQKRRPAPRRNQGKSAADNQDNQDNQDSREHDTPEAENQTDSADNEFDSGFESGLDDAAKNKDGEAEKEEEKK